MKHMHIPLDTSRLSHEFPVTLSTSRSLCRDSMVSFGDFHNGDSIG
jgi:hypothetical protein